MPRKGPFGRLIEHFHTHPKGRLHEFLFWAGLGIVFLALAVTGWLFDWMSEPIAWIVGIVGLCLFLWAFLPQHRAPAAAPQDPRRKSKRK